MAWGTCQLAGRPAAGWLESAAVGRAGLRVAWLWGFASRRLDGTDRGTGLLGQSCPSRPRTPCFLSGPSLPPARLQ